MHYVSRNGFYPETNRAVGSSTRILFCAATFYIAYAVWGIRVIDDMWFWIIEMLAYNSTGGFLRAVGFWVY